MNKYDENGKPTEEYMFAHLLQTVKDHQFEECEVPATLEEFKALPTEDGDDYYQYIVKLSENWTFQCNYEDVFLSEDYVFYYLHTTMMGCNYWFYLGGMEDED